MNISERREKLIAKRAIAYDNESCVGYARTHMMKRPNQ